MGLISSLKQRYSTLPKVGFCDKVKFVAWTVLSRNLRKRGVIDVAGTLLAMRAVKETRPKPRRTFRTLISVNGFAWSGSSACADLLQEYRGITSSFGGGLDDSVEARNKYRFEFDLVRGAGGVYELEHAFRTSNIFERDMAIRLFMKLAYHSYVNVQGFYGEDFMEGTRKFVDKLVASKVPSPTGYDYCHHLDCMGTAAINKVIGRKDGDKSEYLFYLKQLSVEEYRRIAAEYIHSVLNLVESDDFLVMDQGCADGSSDIKRFKDYFGPLKMIYVWRDPRDVFAASNAARGHVGFIPDKPEEFVSWYKRGIGCFDDVADDDLMLVRFEDLVMEYDRVILEIEKFLGIDSSMHANPKKYFTPSKSYDWSIGRWRHYPDQDAIKYIEEHLSKYCWLKPYVRPDGPACDYVIDPDDAFEPGHNPLK